MNTNSQSEFLKALENDEAFSAFWTRSARSEQHQRLRRQTEQGPHPAREALHDYVSGEIDEDEADEIRKHLAFCGICTDEVLALRRIDAEIDEELLALADRSEPPSAVMEQLGQSTFPQKPIDLREHLADEIEIWQPVWAGQIERVNGMDVPKQNHTFMIPEEGNVSIECYWDRARNNEPAYISVIWKADITSDKTLWIRFVDPEKRVVRYEVSTGTYRTGEAMFAQKELGFDPTTEQWAIVVVLQEAIR